VHVSACVVINIAAAHWFTLLSYFYLKLLRKGMSGDMGFFLLYVFPITAEHCLVLQLIYQANGDQNQMGSCC
jgi:hypothetical protein